MKRIVVTGSSGFVGQHLVDALVRRGDQVVIADRRMGTDLSKIDAAYRMMEGPIPDAVVHLASTCSTPASVREPLDTFRDVVQTAVNVLEAARLFAPEAPLIMTTSVKARDGKTPYGAAKRMVELWTKEYRSAYSMQTIINRPGTIYGPGQEGSEDSGWIAWFCRAREEGLPVILNGDGTQIRDLLHVYDYVELLLEQIDHAGLYIGATNDVGGGQSNTVSVLAMAKHLGLRYSFGPDRYGDEMEYVALNNNPGPWKPRIHWKQSETLR